MSQEKFAERMMITEAAIRHEEPERIPIWCQYGITPFQLTGGAVTYRDSMYDFEKASDAIIKFHAEFQPDAQLANLVSGRIEEIAGTSVLDWPGKPGTKVPDDSIYQVLEQDLMHDDEYDEMLNDFTGFLLRKYIPRAFPGLSGLSTILNPAPTGYMYFQQLGSLYNPKAVEAYEKLIETAVCNGWLDCLLVSVGVLVSLYLCKLIRLPYVNARIGGVTCVLVACTLSGTARIPFAVFRFVSTLYGAVVAVLVTIVLVKITEKNKIGNTERGRISVLYFIVSHYPMGGIRSIMRWGSSDIAGQRKGRRLAARI